MAYQGFGGKRIFGKKCYSRWETPSGIVWLHNDKEGKMEEPEDKKIVLDRHGVHARRWLSREVIILIILIIAVALFLLFGGFGLLDAGLSEGTKSPMTTPTTEAPVAQ